MATYKTAAGKDVSTGGILRPWYECTGCRNRYSATGAEVEAKAAAHAADCRRTS